MRRAELCTSTEVDRPSVIGFFSPRILIPAWLMEKLTPQELNQIVLHETGHLRRADDWVNLLQKIGLVLFPLNPALIWVERQLCFERELACDDAVLELTKAPKSYASCLTSLAEHRMTRRGSLSLSLAALGRKSELGRRIHSILEPARITASQARVAFGVAAFVLITGTAGLARCPQLVSFAPAAQIAVSTEPVLAPKSAASLYRPAAFQVFPEPHETLLKASAPAMPSAPLASRTAKPIKRRPAASLIRTSASSQGRPSKEHPSGQWLVLTTWQDSYGARMVLTTIQEPSEPQFSSQFDPGPSQISPYTAVQVRGGWLLIQL